MQITENWKYMNAPVICMVFEVIEETLRKKLSSKGFIKNKKVLFADLLWIYSPDIDCNIVPGF